MPGLRLFKTSYYSHIGANQPIEAGTIKIGSLKGRGSTTRMFNWCKTHSTNPSECINQFITVKNGSLSATILGQPIVNSLTSTSSPQGVTPVEPDGDTISIVISTPIDLTLP